MMDPGDKHRDDNWIAAKREQEAAVVSPTKVLLSTARPSLKELLLLSPAAGTDELAPARREIKLRSPVGLD